MLWRLFTGQDYCRMNFKCGSRCYLKRPACHAKMQHYIIGRYRTCAVNFILKSSAHPITRDYVKKHLSRQATLNFAVGGWLIGGSIPAHRPKNRKAVKN